MRPLQCLGRLWVKIALVIALILWISIEIIARIILADAIEDTQKAVQHNLITVAAETASVLSGNDHVAALAQADSSNIAFQRLRTQMRMLHSSTDFRDHWYTLVPYRGDTVRIGITTNPTSSSGDIYVFRDSTVRRSFYRVLEEKETLATNIYNTANGVWLSGLAPVLDSKGNAVAVLKVDMRYESYLLREEQIYNRVLWIRILGFIAGGCLGMLIGYVVAKPLRTVSMAVQHIAQNDFQGSVTVPLALKYLPDETTQLIINFNQMAAKLETTLKELRTANKELQTLDHAKTVFLQFIAHELRTPLNGLKLLHILPQLQEFDNDCMEVLQGALESTNRLQRFSLAAEQYIQALTHTPDFSHSVDIAEVLPYIIDEYRLHAQRHHIQYEHDDTPLPVCIGYDIIERILPPILNNAVKFSPEKSTITIRARHVNDCVSIAVSDMGRGFSSAVAESIFEPFFVDKIEHHSQGTGINLAIARVLTQCYHGTLTATSRGEGYGSTFTIVLPHEISIPLLVITAKRHIF